MNDHRKLRAASRARRLEQEARNCIAIALGASGGFTADLIDEALRLNGRARDLAREAGGERTANNDGGESALRVDAA